MTHSEPPPRTLPGYLAWRAAQAPDQMAIEVRDHASLTHGQWHERADAVAAALRARGVVDGDRVGLRFGPAGWTEFAVAYCGVQRAGAVAVPLSDRLPPSQVAYALDHCGAVTTVTSASDGNGTVDVPTLLAEGAGATGPDRSHPSGLAQILFTSGTTGRPKGVAATHANLCLGAPTHPRRLRLGHSERFAHAFAVGTNAAQTMLLNALFARPGAISLASFTPGRFARLLEQPGVGTVFLVPAVAIELLSAGVLDDRDLSRIRLVGATAAPLPPAIAVRLAETFREAAIVNYYTSTEAAPAEASMIFDPSRPGAVGRAAAGSLRVTDPNGDPVPAGVSGDVWLRCLAPRHYYQDEAASRAVFDGDWIRMGDVGRLDEDGYLYLVDRHQDIVKTGAFKVSTVEVEAVLHEHPQVADAAVVGLPHPVLGQVLGAVVVPRPDAPPGEPTLATLRRFLLDRLADYQVPAAVLLRDRLDRNEGGKALKRPLADLFAAEGIRP